MPAILSSLDKSLTNAFYDIEIDHTTELPLSLKVVLLAATKGETEVSKDKKIIGGKHVSFQFKYTFTDFNKVEKPAVPKEAQRLLAKS